jgi:hypothetical protein
MKLLLALMKIFGKRYVLLGWLALFILRRVLKRREQARQARFTG